MSVFCFAGCGKDEIDEEKVVYYTNMFGFNMMSTYYLWNEEIAADLRKWSYKDDPIKKVKEIRYKDASGKEIDKWTEMTDDYAAFQGQVTGNTKSVGFDFRLFFADENKQNVIAVVTFTYDGSPASEAGLKRGDKIVALNGTLLTPDNYSAVLHSTILGDNASTLTMEDGREIRLTPRKMYLNPVNCSKVIEKDGKRIGYLHFTSFTMRACSDLVPVFKDFKSRGVSELVLDLRYNGGGYSTTAQLLASMIVPGKEVENRSIFQRDVYNSILTNAWDEELSYFDTNFLIKDEGSEYTVSTAGANLDITKLHVIMTEYSASASEALVCGLMPYMDVDITGKQTGGKYCGGFIVDGPTWFDWVKSELSKKDYRTGVRSTSNWGIYVMVSRYADKNGDTPCMPDGFTPDKEVEDNPLDGYELGDVNETMLAAALGNSTVAPLSARSRTPSLRMEDQLPRKAVRIINIDNIVF